MLAGSCMELVLVMDIVDLAAAPDSRPSALFVTMSSSPTGHALFLLCANVKDRPFSFF